MFSTTMNPLKRKFTFNDDQHEAKKKISCTFDQETISKTSMENLPNEFFYEIFDYLSACEIYHAFSNLNHHFQQLLHSSSLLFKITRSYKLSQEVFQHASKQLTCFHRNQLFSLDLSMSLCTDPLIELFPLDASLSRLESLVLSSLEFLTTFSLFQQLTSLPRLSSLILETNINSTDPVDLYRLVFALPQLKTFIFYTWNNDKPLSLPVNITKEYSPLQYLSIHPCCNFQELLSTISYTPNLRYLNVAQENTHQFNVGTMWPMTLTNLTHLCILVYHAKFEDLENFIAKLDCQLNVFSFKSYADELAYLDGHRWEKLLSKYFPQLKQFYLEYDEISDYATKSAHSYHALSGQFLSSFWLERQWILNVKITSEEIMYLVRPYRERWYEYDRQDKILDSYSSTQLTITDMQYDESLDSYIRDIHHILTIAQIYHLEIVEQEIFANKLLHLTNVLPELLSLKVYSLVLDQSTSFNAEELIVLCSKRLTSKITYVYLEKMNRIEDIFFLMTLCPYLIYLQVDCIGEINIEFFLRSILKTINHGWNDYSRALCFRLPAADDRMMNYLDNMIRSEKLLINYRINRVLDKIYLKWT